MWIASAPHMYRSVGILVAVFLVILWVLLRIVTR